MKQPTRADVIEQLDVMAGGLRLAMTTIRKLKTKQKIDTSPVMMKLAAIRADAKELRDAVRKPGTKS